MVISGTMMGCLSSSIDGNSIRVFRHDQPRLPRVLRARIEDVLSCVLVLMSLETQDALPRCKLLIHRE